MTDIYTIDEVAGHNNAKDLWIAIHGAVYDITDFHKEHPGGEEVLLQLAGQDATECFDSIGHSFEAINLRESYKVGELVDGGASSGKSTTTKKDTAEVKESTEDDWQYQESKSQASSWSWLLISLAVAIYVFIIAYWFKKLVA